MQAIDVIWEMANQLESPEPLQTEPVPERPGLQTPPAHWVEKYWVKRKELRYYRYCFTTARRIHHCHIPGGNIRSGTSKHRAALVESMIEASYRPEQIEQQIQVWRNTGNHEQKSTRSHAER